MFGTTKRNPNDPIPGFEEEGYTGTVGHEKKTHKTHFTMPEKKWESVDDGTWEEYKPGRFRKIKKEKR